MSSSASRRFALLVGFVVLVAAIWLFAGRRAGPTVDSARTAAASTVTAPVKLPAAAVIPPATDLIIAPAPAAAADFHAAIDAARALPDRAARSREFSRILRLWLERDLEGALAYVRASRPSGEFTQGMLLVLDFVAQRDPDRALALAAELALTREQRSFYNSFFAQLAQQNLPSAIERLAQVPPGESRANALRAVTDVWAQRDVSAALDWAQKLPDADRVFAVESALQALVTTDPLRAIKVAQASLTGPALERLLTAALPKLAPEDPAAAATIVTQMPEGETQFLSALSIARELGIRDSASALAWVKTLPVGKTQRLALDNVITGWAEKNAPAAGAYVAQLPAGPAQDAAADHYARLIGAREPQTAITWAQALASESARVTALVTIGSAWAQHEPAAAVAWAASLPDGAGQAGAVTGAFSYWLQRDPTAAQAWLANANLPADVKTRLKKTP